MVLNKQTGGAIFLGAMLQQVRAQREISQEQGHGIWPRAAAALGPSGRTVLFLPLPLSTKRSDPRLSSAAGWEGVEVGERRRVGTAWGGGKEDGRQEFL